MRVFRSSSLGDGGAHEPTAVPQAALHFSNEDEEAQGEGDDACAPFLPHLACPTVRPKSVNDSLPMVEMD